MWSKGIFNSFGLSTWWGQALPAECESNGQPMRKRRRSAGSTESSFRSSPNSTPPAKWMKLFNGQRSSPCLNPDAENGEETLCYDGVTNVHVDEDESITLAAISEDESQFQTAGKYTEAEVARLKQAVELFVSTHGLSQGFVNSLIQNTEPEHTKLAVELWDALYKALPKRGKRQIRKHCRRTYHNFEKCGGVWTQADDERLRDAFLRHPKRWKSIAAELDRRPSACRDRWRDYVSIRDRNTGPWTEAEDRQLEQAIEKASQNAGLEMISVAREGDHANAEAFMRKWKIPWDVVVSELGHGRNRLQCLKRWTELLQRDQDGENDWRRTHRGAYALDRESRRYKAARRVYGGWTTEQKVELLEAIRASEVTSKEHIPWAWLRARGKLAEFSSMERKVAFDTMQRMFPKTGSIQQLISQMLCYYSEQQERESRAQRSLEAQQRPLRQTQLAYETTVGWRFHDLFGILGSSGKRR